MTLNVGGFLSVVKRKRIAPMIQQSQEDMVCPQEIHVKAERRKISQSGVSGLYLPQLCIYMI